MNLSLYIAKRYIVSKKSTNAISIISWISVVAIAVGTAALIIVLSGMNGLTGLVQGLYNSFDSDLEVKAVKGKSFIMTEDLNKKIKVINGIEDVAYCIEDKALLKYDEKQTIVTIKGVSKQFESITRFDTLIYEGKYNLRQGNAYYGILGKGVAFRLGVSITDIFDPITLYSPKRGKSKTFNPAEAFNEYKIYPSALFSINDEFDFKYALVDIDLAKQLFDYADNEVSSLEIKCAPGANLEQTQAELIKVIGKDFIVKNRFQQNEMLFKTLQSEKLWTFIILVFILIVATFNIIGALTMLIIEKKKDIVILNHLGADTKLIRNIFMMEGFLITVIGAVIGLVLGSTLCWLQIKFGFIQFDEGYVVETYPVKVMWQDFVAIIGVVMLIGFFAAWYPVRIFTNKSLSKELVE